MITKYNNIECINGYPIVDYTEQLNGILLKLNQIVTLLSKEVPLSQPLQQTHDTLMKQSKKRVKKNNE